MTDLEQARGVEAIRFGKALQELELQQELQLSRVEAEMSRRGLQNSDARLQAIFEVRLERLNKAILERIAIRRDLLRKYPALGSAEELTHLGEVILADVIRLRKECQKSSLLVPSEVFAQLQARARDGIAALKQEMSPPIPVKPKLPPLALNISRGSAATADVSPAFQRGARLSPVARVLSSAPATSGSLPNPLEEASRKLDEALSTLEARTPPLAAALRPLAAAIQASRDLADERIVGLEQLHFLAEQAARPAALRRISLVKGIIFALRAGLGHHRDLASAWKAVASPLVSHFSIPE